MQAKIPGALALLSAVLLSVVVVSTMHAGDWVFGAGYTAGKAGVSLALGMPVFLVVRYLTAWGRRLSQRGTIDLLCYATLGMWLAQLAVVVGVGFVKPPPQQAEVDPFGKYVTPQR